MDDYERVLLVKPDVHVFRIPPRTTNRAYRASEWNLDAPDWNCRLRLLARGNTCYIRLEERSTGQFFGQCPIDRYPGTAIEAVSDSSRYFVLRLVNDETKRTAFVGIGFVDRSDSFDLNVALQDHFKIVQMEEKEDEKAASEDAGPKLDLGFKEGQTIKVNLNIGKKVSSGKSRPKAPSVGLSGGILLPPPPSGKCPPANSPTTISSLSANSNSDDSSSEASTSLTTSTAVGTTTTNNNNNHEQASLTLHQQLLDGLQGLSVSESRSVSSSKSSGDSGAVPLTPANSLCTESSLLEFSPFSQNSQKGDDDAVQSSKAVEKDLWSDFESFQQSTTTTAATSSTFDDWAKF